MDKKVILSLFAIFIVIASVSAVSAADVNFGKFTLSIDGEQVSNTTLESGGEQVDMYEYETSNGTVSILVMPGQDDYDAIMDSFINEDGYEDMGPVGNYTLLKTPNGEYEGVYFADDYWVGIIFNDLDSGKAILNSFKVN